MKHTEGTWSAKDGQIYPEQTGKTLALIPYFDKDNEQQQADSRLIAAGPDLLENLEAAFNEITTLNNILYKRNIYDLEISAVRQKEMIERILAAINKATQPWKQ